jgi:predicted nuclease of predicted toxin-antitoxin system
MQSLTKVGMKLLLDENLPPSIVSKLEGLGYTCRHIRGFELSGKSDISIVEFAEKEGWIIVTHDLVLGSFLYISGRIKTIRDYFSIG